LLLTDILLSFVDLGVEAIDTFDPNRYYRKNIIEYKKWRQKNNIKSKDLYYLKKKGYLDVQSDTFSLTNMGVERIMSFQAKYITLPKRLKWDKIWRIVIFDIPKPLNKKRDKFRLQLRKLGLKMVQQSIFCYPYDCYDEINQLVSYMELKPYVTFIEAKVISTNDNLVRYFKEKEILL